MAPGQLLGFACYRRIPWPAQHSVRRGGRSMFCADAMGCCRMRGRRSTFIKWVCEFCGRRSVSLIRKRGETKLNPLRRLCVSKRSRSGAVRIRLELGEPSAEILRVEACECVLLSANPLRKSCVSKRFRCGAVRFFCFLCLRIGVWKLSGGSRVCFHDRALVRAVRFRSAGTPFANFKYKK